METVADRIKKKAKELKLKQVDIARLTGASKGTVSLWFGDFRIPEGTYLVKLSEIFNVPVSWILTGKTGSLGSEYGDVYPEKQRFIPVLSTDKVNEWIHGTYSAENEPKIYTNSEIKEKSFAIINSGDSMQNATDQRCIPSGAAVVIEPIDGGLGNLQNQIVLVRFIDDSYSVKLIIKDGPLLYLSPLNARYPTIQLPEDALIVGTAKEAIIKL